MPSINTSDPRDGHAVLSTEEARAGETTGRVRKILVISTVLTAIGLGIVYWIAA
jgi:hypothetical protein